MYLHKEGCEYYQAIFHNIVLISENIIKREPNSSEILVSALKAPGNNEVLPLLKKLYEHSQNIDAEIKKENNAIKIFIDKIGSHIGKFTDPRSGQLFKVMEDLKQIDTNYDFLKRNIENGIRIISEQESNPNSTQGRQLFQAYELIYNELKDIHSASSIIANDMKKIIDSIQTEEQLIQKEKEITKDFNKNMMSWF
jgi:hypothetical protein